MRSARRPDAGGTRPAARARALRVVVAAAVVLPFACLSLGCEIGLPAGKEPYSEFNWTDMGDQPKVKPQRASLTGERPKSSFDPPMGAVARAEQPYPFVQEQAALAAAWGENPLPASPEVLAQGKWVWDNFCITCHGPQAAGDGEVAKKFPPPPSLLRRKVRDYTDARIFHVPMRGQASMPSYAKQLETEELWAVVHFIRKLQSELPVAPPTKQDLEAQSRDGK